MALNRLGLTPKALVEELKRKSYQRNFQRLLNFSNMTAGELLKAEPPEITARIADSPCSNFGIVACSANEPCPSAVAEAT